MTTALHRPPSQDSKHWEKVFRLPLKRAQQLAQQPDDLFDAAEEVLDRVLADRLLVAHLHEGTIPWDFFPVKVTPEALNDVLVDVAHRLVTALEEMRDLVKRHCDQATAEKLVALARREGRIPPEEV